jgi:hypothetical protein
MPRLSKIGAAALAAFGWTAGATVSASYLVVAGGGGGAQGGAGAGGLLTGSTSLNPTLSYAITVGAGGTGGPPTSVGSQTNGSDSVFNSLTATGGGFGGRTGGGNGNSGGSGGGGAYATNGGAGTSGQGSAGGNGGGASSAGGGGGASAVGSAGSGSTGGNGGNGTASSISGSSVTYAGGGGGAANTTAGSGGTGGGGAGGVSTTNGTAGTTNLGGGGGGGGASSSTGGSGGSGVVIISYPAPQKFGGGVVTTSGSNVIHTFNTSGTLAPLSSLTASYLIVAGGGGGGNSSVGNYNGSGGGAGGLLSGSGITIDPNSTYLVTVGAGGSSGGPGTSGTNSTFSMVTTTAIGGGRGGSGGNGVQGATGGSGGGSTGPFTALPPTAGGLGTAGQGNNGGPASQYSGSGGGGAGAVGTGYVNTSTPTGGAGVNSSISGASVGYAGGGSGGGTPSPGFGGGTGADVSGTSPATAGIAGTGGGGGGGSNPTTASANGGSGVVIISYAGSTQQMAGGTVTITGGNVIHTFTSSGYLTPIKYVNNSLRFRSSASAYLNRTPSVASNRKTWTWSGWVKRGALGVYSPLFVAGTTNGQQVGSLAFSSAGGTYDKLELNFGVQGTSTEFWLQTTAVYRDPAAWYHIVCAVDTTQATASNRVKFYVNGTQITALSAYASYSQYPSQNYDTSVNNAVQHLISRDQVNTAGYFDGYQTEINFIDGQALTPNSFGTFNSYGVWQPITYGGSYGTNGFYLPFTNTASPTTLAYDFSPNGNNWTTNNISLTAGSTYDSMTDVPTLTSATAANYCVMNPLTLGSYVTLSSGNLITTGNTATDNGNYRSTFAFKTGKWYLEVTCLVVGGVSNNPRFGILPLSNASTPNNGSTNSVGSVTNSGAYQSNGQKYIAGTTSSYGSSFTTGDVIGVAIDADNGTLVFYKNNTSQGTAFTWTGGSIDFVVAGSDYNSSSSSYNFGQQPWVYTPPTGFVALNTYNL